MYHLSKEYLNVTLGGPSAATISADVITMAIVPYGTAPTTFLAAENTAAGCRILIGPGTTVGQLTPGQYQVWVDITDNPEIPVLLSGDLRIT